MTGHTSARSRRVLIGLAILTLAQFASWGSEGGGTVLMSGLGPGVYATLASTTVSGWKLHPLALVFLPALFAVHGLGIQLGDSWRRWGLWITLAMMAYCATFRLSVIDSGALLAWLGIAVAASALRIKEA